MKISARIKTKEEKAISGFIFKVKDDGFGYCQIFPKQKNYIKLVVSDVEFADYKKKVVRKKKEEPVE